MRIGEAARRLGVTPQYLRWAEAKGKIPSPRTVLGQRAYSEADVALLRRVGVGSKPPKLKSVEEAVLEASG